MRRTAYVLFSVLLIGSAGLTFAEAAQNTASDAPTSARLLFRESFPNIVDESNLRGPQPNSPTPVALTEQHVTNANVEMKLYGPGAKAVPEYESGLLLQQAVDGARPGESVSYIWSGVTEDNWGLMLRHKNNYLDLRGPAKIRWRTRTRSLYQTRLLIKLADGTMLAADYVEPESSYWRETEFYLADVPRWRMIEETGMAVARDSDWKTDVDFSRVDEVGFTDLMRGAGHGTNGNSGVDWIEVHGNPVSRGISRN